MKSIFILLCFVFAVLAFNLLFSKRDLEIQGGRYKYRLPIQQFQYNTSYSYYFGYKGDEAKVLSLIIPDFKANGTDVKGELLLLIFLDSNSGVDNSVRNYVLKTIKDNAPGDKLSYASGFFRFSRKLGEATFDYLVSFDPFSKQKGNNEEEFFIIVRTEPPIKIDGHKEVVPQKTCDIHFVIDNLKLEVGSVGALCQEKVLLAVAKSFVRQFKSWRIPE